MVITSDSESVGPGSIPGGRVSNLFFFFVFLEVNKVVFFSFFFLIIIIITNIYNRITLQ